MTAPADVSPPVTVAASNADTAVTAPGVMTRSPGAWHRAGALTAIILWGLSFVATKAALREISPITLIFTRFAIGSALLVSLLAVRRQPLVPPRDTWASLALMGFVGVFVHQVVQSYGLT
ncbi:MAG TPA: DMT family transporter, partial [Patescibacteria group bacterium]|nr:DMT family transporter [Patescibacteria group bacterium]